MQQDREKAWYDVMVSTTRTIGLFLASLHTGAANEMWPAVLSRAMKRGVNLVCYPGGRLNAVTEYEHQRNAVYSLARPGYLDGLISWASSLGGMVDQGVLEGFHRQFAEIPLITLSHQIEGFPVVRVDAYAGMFRLVEHLVTVHGHRRIAFLRGPDNHLSAQDRWNGYRDALQSLGISYDEKLCIGPYRWDGGAEAATDLLDRLQMIPGTHFDALVGASDLLSFRAIQAMQSRGYHIPRDLAVAGFNDTAESRLSSPPMTTVAMPFRIQGEKALDNMVDLVEGKQISRDELLPSRLVVRQSCGCHGRNLALGDGRPVIPWKSELPWKDQFFLEAKDILGLDEDSAQAWLPHICSAIEHDIASLSQGVGDLSTKASTFIETLRQVLDRASQRESGLMEWQEVLTLLKDQCQAFVPFNCRDGFLDLVHKVRIFLADRIQLESDKKHWSARSQVAIMQDTGRQLLESHSIEELGQVLAEKAPELGIPGVWLVLDGILRMACIDQTMRELPSGGLAVASDELLPEQFLPRNRTWALVVEPLYFHEESYGYAVFEAGNRQGGVYEELRGYLSSAVRGIYLFDEVLAARRLAEKADNIKTRLLANVSHELRSPLSLIQGHARNAAQGREGDRALLEELHQIEENARHQLRVVNDLLDLTRAEIDELDLHRELLDLGPLLKSVFDDYCGSLPENNKVSWNLIVPASLPLVWVDGARMRQIVLNLLSNAARHTSEGSVELGAVLEANMLHFWVRDTGCGISAEQQERVFEPFVSGVSPDRNSQGIGLGLSITRHMIILHEGQLTLDSTAGEGATFHVRIPVPSLGATGSSSSGDHNLLLVISHDKVLSPGLANLARDQGLEPRFIAHLDDVEKLEIRGASAILAWDLTNARASDWIIIRKLRQHPSLFQAPFMVFGGDQLGTTSLVSKTSDQATLLESIERCCPSASKGTIFVVDDDALARDRVVSTLAAAMPDQVIRAYNNGHEALEAMAGDVPGLVLLDFVMPRLSGADVLDRMRQDERLRHVPVLILSNKVFDQNDLKRLEGHAQVVLQNKGIWTDGEMSEAVNRLLLEGEPQTPQTSALVKRAILYLNQHYTQPLSRWQVADAVNVSEDYLSRVFNRELAISPWEYLNRYRVWQAGRHLVSTTDSIRNIALSTGFSDQAYFSRVFRKVTGMSPQEFRQKG